MKNQRIYNFTMLVMAVFFLTFSCSPQKEGNGKELTKSKPNIVILFVDDWGWADLEYRNDVFETPNINKFRKQSLEFTRAYIPTPTCSPSRASLLTGIEAARLEMPRHIVNKDLDGTNSVKYNYWPTDPSKRSSINWLPLEEETYAEYLKKQGYFNFFLGKWHLGHEPYHPVHQGFDRQYATGNWGHPQSYYQRFFKDDDVLKDIPEDKYLTDVLTDEAVSFIGNYSKEKPFQMSFWYYNVHGPHEGPDELVKKYLDKGLDKQYAEYGAMVEAMDLSVGRIQKALEENQLADNTIVFLISDQGGYFTNAPLSGGKRGGNTLGEGGARIPMMVLYPGVTKAGTTCGIPIQSIDIFPTLTEIVSGKVEVSERVNGRSILPLIKGEEQKPRDLFFFRAYEDQSSAIIRGDWKLIKYLSGKYELFNIREDEAEKQNLLESEPQMAETLREALENWEKEALPPIHNKL